MDENSTLELWKQIEMIDPVVWCGVMAAIVTFIVEIWLSIKFRFFDGVEKKIERAKAADNVILAKRIRCWYKDRSEKGTANRIYYAVYQYTVNGKSRKKQIVSTSMEPPYTISIYYEKTPDKVFTEYDRGRNPCVILIYIIPVLVAYVVMMALGFEV